LGARSRHPAALSRQPRTPPRPAKDQGEALSAGVRALSQAIIIYILSYSLGAGISLSPLHILGVALALLLGSALFSLLSLVIACIVKTRERFMGIGQMLTMPIFFASNAIYPLALMPGWMRAVSHVNPLTYQVDALRALMLVGGTSDFGLGLDFSILVFLTGIMAAVAAYMYPRMGY
jgi:ABC-2 type transport system permease protein